MLEIITGVLGSTGFGAVFGGVMGLLNRRADLKYKKLEMEDRDKERLHELKQRELDAKLMEQEAKAKIEVAEMAGSFAALEKSYDFAQPEKGSRMASFSSFIRPFISLSYFLVSSLGAAYIVYYAFNVANVKFTEEQWYDLAMFVIDWVFFMSSACIGWWYAMRSGKAPTVR